MERALWTGPATGVLVVGGGTTLLFALVLPETRPSGLVGGMVLLLVAAALALYARHGRRRARPARRPVPARPTTPAHRVALVRRIPAVRRGAPVRLAGVSR